MTNIFCSNFILNECNRYVVVIVLDSYHSTRVDSLWESLNIMNAIATVVAFLDSYYQHPVPLREDLRYAPTSSIQHPVSANYHSNS